MNMIKELSIGFLIILIVSALSKILFNYNIRINIIYWAIDSIFINSLIIILSLLIIFSLIFVSKFKK